MYSEGKIDKDTLLYNRDKYKLPHSRDFTWIRFDGLDNAGEEETYDIEVEGPDHNFIANSFVVHNSTGLVDKYVAGRNGSRPNYLVPELEPILRETYGVMVYQEQIMRICTDLAGYTAAEADGMRKAIGKKIAGMMVSQRDEFVQGCVKNGIAVKAASQLFDDIEGFAKYSFNKAHSVAYSIVSYRTAWLKHYYPEEFYCSLLNNTIKEQGQLVKYIYSCKENGIAIEPPDINRSGALFTIDSGTILFGLGGIKGIGEKTCERLLDKRETGFGSLSGLIAAGASSKDIKALARCGALESITELGRESIVNAVDDLIKYYNKLSKWEERKQRFDERENEIREAIQAGHKPPKHLPKLPTPPEQPKVEDSIVLSKEERIQLEHETLGFYLTGHPLDSYPDLYRIATHNLERILSENLNGAQVRFPAVISTLNKKRTRKGKDMATLIVEDKTARAEVTIFPSTWKKLKDEIAENMIAVLTCKADREAGEEASITRLVLNDFQEVTDPSIFEAQMMDDLVMHLGDGSMVRFIVTERTPRGGWERAIAILNNLEDAR
jgi:DNA polymerase-3 subunit alpha